MNLTGEAGCLQVLQAGSGKGTWPGCGADVLGPTNGIAELLAWGQGREQPGGGHHESQSTFFTTPGLFLGHRLDPSRSGLHSE